MPSVGGELLTTLRREMLPVIIPVSKALSSIHMPYSRKLITGPDYYQMRELVRPGDAVLTSSRGELSSLFIPGEWDHGALAAGGIGDHPENLIEATTKGVEDPDLVSFMFNKDYMIVLRPKFLTPEQGIASVRWARRQVGLPYDWAFQYSTSNNRAFYCFELIAASWQGALGPGVVSPFQPRMRLGVPTFTGDDFVKAAKLFEVIWFNGPTMTSGRRLMIEDRSDGEDIISRWDAGRVGVPDLLGRVRTGIQMPSLQPPADCT